MASDREIRPTNQLCSVVARAAGEDPISTATLFEHRLLIEVASPWEDDVADSRHYPDELWRVLNDAYSRNIPVSMTAILPDPEYSSEGETRILSLRRPREPFARYEREEYVVPDAELIPAVEALCGDRRDLSSLEECRLYTGDVRDIVVCTHGSHDACCGKFGYPIYERLRGEYAESGKLRVWRASHIGGHRFAPTLIDFPEGRYWAFLEPENLENLVLRNKPVSELRGLYRGWSAMQSNYEQIVEREILIREGWRWAAYPKTGHVLSASEDESRAEVRIDYIDPDGSFGSYEAAVEQSGTGMTLPKSGPGPLEETKQYGVVGLERVS